MSRRIKIGRFSDGGCGIRVAKPGYDADENPPVQAHLAFNSDWMSMLPIHENGSFTPSGVGYTKYFVNGDVGFVPFFTYALSVPGNYTKSGSSSGLKPYVYVTSNAIVTNISADGFVIYYTIFKIRAI